MSKAEAIRELIDKIEAGELQEYHNPSQFKALPFPQRSRAAAAFMGKLDAALALHQALLPGWRLETMFKSWDGSWVATAERQEDCALRTGKAQTPARAWLIAILKAHLAEVDRQDHDTKEVQDDAGN